VAKDQGGNRVHVYEPDDRAVAHRYGEMRWVQRIKEAFEGERFRLVAQPIWRLADLPPDGTPPPGAAPMAEILLRMLDDEGRPHPTPSFIAAAERYHLMHDIDRWVVRRALAAIAAAGGETVYTINLSGQSLGESSFLDYVLAELAAGPVPGGRLCFEITETATITNLARARRFIAALKERGCRFVLDDFGTGLSSFAYLKTLPVDFLKIDGEFVRHLASDPVQRALVESINSIGQLIGLATIAEAVETDEALAALRGVGVDYVQGFRLGRPAAFGEGGAAGGAGTAAPGGRRAMGEAAGAAGE
jgi:EAL domain-containing protein (putative c-di-GMP-specific phosphodiesterase class I)